MIAMKELKSLSEKELGDRLNSVALSLSQSRLKMSRGETTKISELREMRRDIARINTAISMQRKARG